MARRCTGPKWYKSRRSYFAKINGVAHNLGPELGAANRRYAELTLRAPTLNANITVRDLVEAYLAAGSPTWRPSTLDMRSRALRPFVAKYGATLWSELIPYHVTTFQVNQLTWTNGTRRIFVSALKACFRWAKRQGLISTNPVADIERPPANVRGDHCLITEEQRRLLLAAAGTNFQDVLEALWHTGNRPGYIITVEAAEVVRDRWDCGPKPGRKIPRAVIYLNEAMHNMTQRLMALHPKGPLFRNENGDPWTYDAARGAMRRARKAAGIKGVTLYWYRHSFGRRALANGVNVADLAILMNTSVAMIEKTYGHPSTLSDRLKASLKQVG
jgi:site-specific recombinase XerD